MLASWMRAIIGSTAARRSASGTASVSAVSSGRPEAAAARSAATGAVTPAP